MSRRQAWPDAVSTAGPGTSGTPSARMSITEVEIERQIPSLRRFAWSLTRHSQDADDLVQDCLERALTRGGSYRADAPPRAWLFAILYNLFVSGRRRARHRAHEQLDDIPDLGQEGGQERHIAFLQVLVALGQLPDDQRAVVVLVGVEDFTYEEAAAALGLPIGTVMSRLSRGRDRLRQVLAADAKPPAPAGRVQ